MAAAAKVPQGATHSFTAKQDYISLLLTQQEADWLYEKLSVAGGNTRSMQDQIIISSIADALTPVTGYQPS